MLEEESRQDLLEQNYLFNKRRNARLKNRFIACKNRLFILAVLSGLSIIIILYFLSSYSKLNGIEVNNNYFLSERDIFSLTDLNNESRFLLISKNNIRKKIEADPLVDKAEIRRIDNNVLSISIKENKVLGYFKDGEAYSYLLSDGATIALNDNNQYMKLKAPLIEGFTSDKLSKVSTSLAKLNEEEINDISEIHYYPLSYDENMVELIMVDGNYIFISLDSIKLLNNYYDIKDNSLSSKNVCLYFDEDAKVAYKSSCPWEKENKSDDLSQSEE